MEATTIATDRFGSVNKILFDAWHDTFEGLHVGIPVITTLSRELEVPVDSPTLPILSGSLRKDVQVTPLQTVCGPCQGASFVDKQFGVFTHIMPFSGINPLYIGA